MPRGYGGSPAREMCRESHGNATYSEYQIGLAQHSRSILLMNVKGDGWLG
jgi:hypothetical protein